MSREVAKHLYRTEAQTIDVLVTVPQSVVNRLQADYGILVKRFIEGGGAVLTVKPSQLDRLAGDAQVTDLAEDGTVFSRMAVTTQAMGADKVWSGDGKAFGGITGNGVNVAVIDSGIAPNDDIKNRIIFSKDFTRASNSGSGSSSTALDEYGHGTHIAGIIAGSGNGSRTLTSAAFTGMAPGAGILNLKVLKADGSGLVSTVIDAVEWCIRNRENYKIRVINLSLGRPSSDNFLTDPLVMSVERAVRAGIVVVAAAGNLGTYGPNNQPIVGAIESPGYAPDALTVGATNTHNTVYRSDDTVTSWSSRGPVGNPENPSSWMLKPDVVAPGNNIIAAASDTPHPRGWRRCRGWHC